MVKPTWFALIKNNLRRKHLTIGVEIGHEYLRLAKIIKSSHNLLKLLAYKKVPLPPKTPRGTPEFANFLRSEITRFMAHKGVYVWLSMSAAHFDVHRISIPKTAKRQIENAVFWTLKKESPFEEKGTVLDFEVLGETIGHGVPKRSVIAYTVPGKEVEEIKKLISGIGLPVTGVAIVPFAIQNILRTKWIPSLDGTVSALFIGNDFSRIDIYAKGNLVMSRDIKTGVNSFAGEKR